MPGNETLERDAGAERDVMSGPYHPFSESKEMVASPRLPRLKMVTFVGGRPWIALLVAQAAWVWNIPTGEGNGPRLSGCEGACLSCKSLTL